MQTSTRSSKYLGSGLSGACSQHQSRFAADAAAAATQERLRKCGGRQGGDKGIAISHSPFEPIVPAVDAARQQEIQHNH